MSACAHHWDIEQANGHASKGTCLKCGETRDFLNALPEELNPHAVRLVRSGKGTDDHVAAPDGERADIVLPRLPMVPGAVPGNETDGRRVDSGRPLAEDSPAVQVEKGDAMSDASHPRSGDLRLRCKELEPARRRAEELYRQGKDPCEVVKLLEPDFGKIAAATVNGWRKRLRSVTQEPSRNAKSATCAKTQTDPDGELWQMVMDARPDWTDKPRLGRWMDMVDAVYAFLVEC